MTPTVPNTNPPPPGGAPDLTERIVDTALALAEERGSWSAVRLHDVADRLSLPTPHILDHYRDLDAVADAWFQRGLKAMVAPNQPISWIIRSGGVLRFAWSHGSIRSLSTGV